MVMQQGGQALMMTHFEDKIGNEASEEQAFIESHHPIVGGSDKLATTLYAVVCTDMQLRDL